MRSSFVRSPKRFATVILVALLLSTLGTTAGAATDPWIAYGFGSPDPTTTAQGFVAVALPSGKPLGQAPIRRQGGGFAVSPNGNRVYLLDGDDFRELAVPSLQVFHDVTLPDPINILGIGMVVAAAVDGRAVYVETMRIVGPNRWDPRLRVGQPESDYGIAVYDTNRGAFSREISLSPPWCGVADLLALPDGRLAVFCTTSSDLRLVDPARGAQVAQLSLGTLPGAGSYGGWPVAALVSRDGRHVVAVDNAGRAIAVDLATLSVERTGDLSDGDGSRVIPSNQSCPCLVADGSKVVVGAAPGDGDSLSTGHATRVWIGDTATLHRVAVLLLPFRAFDLAPTPDGRLLIASGGNEATGREPGISLIDLTSGRVLAHWPGQLTGIQIH